MQFFDRWGNFSSVVGLLISVVGLVATFWMAYRAKIAAEASESAADAAKRAAEETRKWVSRLETVTTFAEVLAIMDELKRLHLQKHWMPVIAHCSKLQRMLIAVRHSLPEITEGQKAVFTSAIQHFKNLEEKVAKAVQKETDPTGIANAVSLINLLCAPCLIAGSVAD